VIRILRHGCDGLRRGLKRPRKEKTMHTFKVGRDAKTGEFIPVKEAQRKPSTTVVETIKVPTHKPKPSK